MTVALTSLQVVCTCATCTLLTSCWQPLVTITRSRQVILPSHDLLSPSSANAQLTNSRSTQGLLLLQPRVTAKSRLLAARVRTSARLTLPSMEAPC
jgi:hypothetical protein